MTPKSFRFDEKDEELWEKARKKASFLRSDIDILRYALTFLIETDVKINIEPEKVEKKNKEEIPEYVLERYKTAVKNDTLCPIHTKLLSQCGCLENGEFMNYLLKLNGITS